MAIAQMSKVMIASHRSEAKQLLEALQAKGIFQILDAQRAMVSKEWPELHVEGQKPRQIVELVARLDKAVAFLKDNYQGKPLVSALAPKVVIDETTYQSTVQDKAAMDLLEKTEDIETSIEKHNDSLDAVNLTLASLTPWASLSLELQEMNEMATSTCFAGQITSRNFDELVDDLSETGSIVEVVSQVKNTRSCIIVCLNENASATYKALRAVDFEQANFENLTGTVADNINRCSEKIQSLTKQIDDLKSQAAELAKSVHLLQILSDHNANLAGREQTWATSPATEHAVLLEGWVRKNDYKKLEKVVADFSGSSISKMEIAEDETVPVEIKNNTAFKPFEVITRLYGMPQHFELDPTVLLAPFFAIFFALCLTDAGYGLIIIAFCAYLILKMQGDKKLIWLLGICSILTLGAGAATGGWFGDAPQQLAAAYPDKLGWLDVAREKMLIFDPLEKPMVFFGISCGLGYIQIMVGLLAGFVHNLMKKDVIAALCDQLTWLVMINSIVIFGAAKMGMEAIPPSVGGIFGKIALIPAAGILLFSQREGPIGGRIGMGAYNLFSTIFYLGDVLSYLRLMALGMVTGGLAMAINVMAKTAGEIPYIGIILAVVVLIGGHLFNAAISGLSAFVHTIRLQFVEFFPKFLEGGGQQFDPLKQEYKHVYRD